MSKQIPDNDDFGLFVGFGYGLAFVGILGFLFMGLAILWR